MYKNIITATAKTEIFLRDTADNISAGMGTATLPLKKFRLAVEMQKLEIRHNRGDIDLGTYNARSSDIAKRYVELVGVEVVEEEVQKELSKLAKDFDFKDLDAQPAG